MITCATAVVIIDPPDPPAISRTFEFLSKMITGTELDKGRLSGFIKLTSEGGNPNSFVIFGELKSSISLL